MNVSNWREREREREQHLSPDFSYNTNRILSLNLNCFNNLIKFGCFSSSSLRFITLSIVLGYKYYIYRYVYDVIKGYRERSHYKYHTLWFQICSLHIDAGDMSTPTSWDRPSIHPSMIEPFLSENFHRGGNFTST